MSLETHDRDGHARGRSPRTGESRALAFDAGAMIQQSRQRCSVSQITLVRSRAILAESALAVRRGGGAADVLRERGQGSPQLPGDVPLPRPAGQVSLGPD